MIAPKTADGVEIVVGMTVWAAANAMHHRWYGEVARLPDDEHPHTVGVYGMQYPMSYRSEWFAEDLYSTRATALTAWIAQLEVDMADARATLAAELAKEGGG